MAEDHQSNGGGYGKPPKHSQFKPGQSGNPAGRPRKTKPPTFRYTEELTPSDRMILEEADRLVRVREGDQLFELSQAQAAMRSTYAKAMKGSPMAQRIIIEQNQRVQALEMRRRQKVWDSYQSYVARWRETAARARAEGRPDPEMLPHPDDIEFGNDLCVYVRGPMDTEQLKRHLVTVDVRELFLAMNAYGTDRQCARNASDDSVDLWLFSSCVLNASLPPSLRLGGDALIARGDTLVCMTAAKLVDHIAELCRRLQLPLKSVLHLSRHGRTPLRRLGVRREQGQLALERGWSPAKLVKRMWADISPERMTTEQLDLMHSIGLVAPRSWMARARGHCV